MARPMIIPQAADSANEITPKNRVCACFCHSGRIPTRSCGVSWDFFVFLWMPTVLLPVKVVHKLAPALMDRCSVSDRLPHARPVRNKSLSTRIQATGVDKRTVLPSGGPQRPLPPALQFILFRQVATERGLSEVLSPARLDVLTRTPDLYGRLFLSQWSPFPFRIRYSTIPLGVRKVLLGWYDKKM
ncbi:hypothetical protein CEXT_269401 [Caerostris extrusa]|uniref:Uncharacterized protein n=1 Tax=Caerostris extrusa TaxID=172846 RepID=A0AAV4SE97_CAEEX|nr:hypothetical protein CEXT_269401 [Caerostris extrusa]